MVVKRLNNCKVQCKPMELSILMPPATDAVWGMISYLTVCQVDPRADDNHQAEYHQNGKLNPTSPDPSLCSPLSFLFSVSSDTFFFFSWFQHPFTIVFFLGLLLYLLTIIMYISQSGSGTSGRGKCERALHGSPPPCPGVLLYLCVSDARDIAVMK